MMDRKSKTPDNFVAGTPKAHRRTPHAAHQRRPRGRAGTLSATGGAVEPLTQVRHDGAQVAVIVGAHSAAAAIFAHDLLGAVLSAAAAAACSLLLTAPTLLTAYVRDRAAAGGTKKRVRI